MREPQAPRPPLRARARAHLARIALENASPARLFAACVVGAIVGSTPLFGLHLPLCVAAARWLRLNQVAVYGAANVSIPPVAPFLAFACVEAGSRLLTGHGAALTPEALRHVSPWTLAGDVFAAWIAGAPLVGGLVGVALGAVVASMAAARRRPEAERSFVRAARETAARFARASRYHRHYVPWKIRLDPVYRAICDQLPAGGELVELGCGLGILPLLAVQLGKARRAHGIDWDEPKVHDAQRACDGLPITIEHADVRAFAPPACDAIAIVDVLHYFDAETQDAILARAAASLRERGVLFVRDGEAGDGGSRWTRAVERLAVAIGWNRSAARRDSADPTTPVSARPPGAAHGYVRFRPIADIVTSLERLGFRCSVTPVAGALHPGNVLVRATRPSC